MVFVPSSAPSCQTFAWFPSSPTTGRTIQPMPYQTCGQSVVLHSPHDGFSSACDHVELVKSGDPAHALYECLGKRNVPQLRVTSILREQREYSQGREMDVPSFDCAVRFAAPFVHRGKDVAN